MKANIDIEEKIKKLSPDLIKELDQYLDLLLSKKSSNQTKRFKQNWAGDLKDIDYDSNQFQKKALDWRIK